MAFSLFKESILLAPALRAVPGLVEGGSPRQDNTRCHEIFYILGGALIPAREPGRFCGRAIWLVPSYEGTTSNMLSALYMYVHVQYYV